MSQSNIRTMQDDIQEEKNKNKKPLFGLSGTASTAPANVQNNSQTPPPAVNTNRQFAAPHKQTTEPNTNTHPTSQTPQPQFKPQQAAAASFAKPKPTLGASKSQTFSQPSNTQGNLQPNRQAQTSKKDGPAPSSGAMQTKFKPTPNYSSNKIKPKFSDISAAPKSAPSSQSPKKNFSNTSQDNELTNLTRRLSGTMQQNEPINRAATTPDASQPNNLNTTQPPATSNRIAQTATNELTNLVERMSKNLKGENSAPQNFSTPASQPTGSQNNVGSSAPLPITPDPMPVAPNTEFTVQKTSPYWSNLKKEMQQSEEANLSAEEIIQKEDAAQPNVTRNSAPDAAQPFAKPQATNLTPPVSSAPANQPVHPASAQPTFSQAPSAPSSVPQAKPSAPITPATNFAPQPTTPSGVSFSNQRLNDITPKTQPVTPQPNLTSSASENSTSTSPSKSVAPNHSPAPTQPTVKNFMDMAPSPASTRTAPATPGATPTSTSTPTAPVSAGTVPTTELETTAASTFPATPSPSDQNNQTAQTTTSTTEDSTGIIKKPQPRPMPRFSQDEDANYKTPENRLVSDKQAYYSSLHNKTQRPRVAQQNLDRFREILNEQQQNDASSPNDETQNLKRQIEQKYGLDKKKTLPVKKIGVIAIAILVLWGGALFVVFNKAKTPTAPVQTVQEGKNIPIIETNLPEEVMVTQSQVQGINYFDRSATPWNSYSEGQVLRLNIVDNNNKKRLKRDDALKALLGENNFNNLPQGLLPLLNEEYNIVAFKSDGEVRLGLTFSFNSARTTDLKNQLTAWENTGNKAHRMHNVLRKLFLNAPVVETTNYAFSGFEKESIEIRYVNLPNPDIAMDYFIYNNLLTFTTSKDTTDNMLEAIQ